MLNAPLYLNPNCYLALPAIQQRKKHKVHSTAKN